MPSRVATSRDLLVRTWPVLTVVLVLVVLGVVHLTWLERFRRGLPLDIDEAGYLGFALDDVRGWRSGGLNGLFDAAVMQRQFGPLVPLTAAPLLRIFSSGPLTGMAVQLVFLAILAFASYGLGSRLAGRGAGILVTVVTLLSPGVFDFTRTFHFVLATAAFLCLAIWALVLSDGLERRGFVVVAGIAIGLLLLSRSYAIAFLPGLAAAAVALGWQGLRARRRRTIVNAAIGSVVAAVVAGWWYVPNLDPVFRYLTHYGYGNRSQAYASDDDSSPFSVTFWTVRLSQLLTEGIYLVPAVLLTISVACFFVLRARTRRRERIPGPLRSRTATFAGFVTSPAGAIAVTLTISYLVLTSSVNRGTGFVVPLVPLLLTLGIACLVSLPTQARAVIIIFLLLSVGATALGKTTLSGPLAEQHCVELPALECVTLNDGRGHIQDLLASFGLRTTDPDRTRHGAPAQWVQASRDAAVALRDAAAGSPLPVVVFFASRDPLFNTNTVGLVWRQRVGEALSVGQLRPDDGGDTRLNYLRKLTDPQFGQPTFLFTTDRGRYEFRPRVTQSLAEEAAACVHFTLRVTLRLPDGRAVRLFERRDPLPASLDGRALRNLSRRCAPDQG